MKKIIHVDNSGFFRKIMRVFLEGEGFSVEGFGSPEDANIAIQGGSAAMVISGLELAGTGGEAFIKRTIEDFHGPVVVVSSSLDAKKETALQDIGVKACIGKAGDWKGALRRHLRALE